MVSAAGSPARRGRPRLTRGALTGSATVANIAQALIGDRDIPIQVTGIRPGEKFHDRRG